MFHVALVVEGMTDNLVWYLHDDLCNMKMLMLTELVLQNPYRFHFQNQNQVQQGNSKGVVDHQMNYDDDCGSGSGFGYDCDLDFDCVCEGLVEYLIQLKSYYYDSAASQP